MQEGRENSRSRYPVWKHVKEAVAARKARKRIEEKGNLRERYRLALGRPGAGLDVVLKHVQKLYRKAADHRVKADLLKIWRDTLVDIHHLAYGRPAVMGGAERFTPDEYEIRLRKYLGPPPEGTEPHPEPSGEEADASSP